MLTKKQVEALKKAKKKELDKLIKKTLVRREVKKKLDRTTLLLQKKLREDNEMLYNIYKSGDLYAHIPYENGKPVPEKKVLAKLLEVNQFFRKMKYSPREEEAFSLVAVLYKAKVPLEELEKGLKEVDKQAKDPEDRKYKEGLFLRRVITFYKLGYAGENLVEMAVDQTLRKKGRLTRAREESWRTATEGAEQRMEKLGIKNPELEEMMANMLSRGKEVNVDGLAKVIDELSEINPYYGEQARRIVEENLASPMTLGTYSEETIRALEERLEMMLEEARKRAKKKD